jgi:tetratricopeptide (TPR) repeat protein
MDTEQPVAGLIQRAYEQLKAGDAAEAANLLEEALRIDFDSAEVKRGLKCVHWWLERTKRLEDMHNPYEKGGFILSQLQPYYVFLERFEAPAAGSAYEQCDYAVRRFVFSSALRCFEDLLGDGVNQHDPGLLLLVGRCYKGVGNYDEALKYLEQAVRFKREDGETLAELADVNALMGENRTAKVLFREAFFLDPQGIDLRAMESELILRLRNKVEELGYGGPDLCEWIPVFGCILNVFSVKRELKPLEVGRLKQSIFSMETELRGDPERNAALKPRLINRYFWLIDHYENTREDTGLIEETQLKIKVTDSAIYERYIK